jgi:hypothetical protein
MVDPAIAVVIVGGGSAGAVPAALRLPTMSSTQVIQLVRLLSACARAVGSGMGAIAAE